MRNSVIRKGLIVGILLLFVGMNIPPLSNVNAYRTTIYVPDDYPTIKSAIENATNGVTIIVRDGTYIENIIVNKCLTIKSQNGAANCVIKAAASNSHVVSITQNTVNFSGFSITGANGSQCSGINLYGRQYCNISNNKIYNNFHGLRLYSSVNNFIVHNTLYNHDLSQLDLTSGIYLYNSNNNFILNNYNYNNNVGISLQNSKYNIIKNNSGNVNYFDAIFLMSASSYNEIIDNKCIGNNKDGITLYQNCQYNNITNNTIVNGSENGIWIGWECNYNNFTNNYFNNNQFSIYHIKYSNHNNYIKNTIKNSYWYAFTISESDNNTLCNNTIAFTNHYHENTASVILSKSCYNLIKNNSISDHPSGNGIRIGYLSLYNNIIENSIFNNKRGIYIWNADCPSNSIYQNNFFNNNQNVLSISPNNIWHNVSLQQGNYWHDYTGTDSDGNGIGDIPYSIPGGTQDQDNFPLMTSYGPPHAAFTYAVNSLTINYNASLSYDYNGDIVSYDWNFGDNTTGTGIKINHTYIVYGIYNVTLTVTDNGGKEDTLYKMVSTNFPPLYGTPNPTNESTGHPLNLTWSIPINDSDSDLFDWTIQCSNGQTNGGTVATNGTKTLTLTGLTYSTTYKVWVNATDPTGSDQYTRRWYTFTTKENNPPNTPTITGPASGKIKVNIAYNFTTIDPDGDKVSYYIDWGDETNSGWIGPYTSGDVVTKSHTWTKKGDYTIKAKAKDSSGAESGWGELPVTMPCSLNLPFMQLWIRFFERFPNAFPIVRHLLGY